MVLVSTLLSALESVPHQSAHALPSSERSVLGAPASLQRVSTGVRLFAGFPCPAVQLKSIREAAQQGAQSSSALAAELEAARREAAAAKALVASEQERNASLQRAKEVRRGRHAST